MLVQRMGKWSTRSVGVSFGTSLQEERGKTAFSFWIASCVWAAKWPSSWLCGSASLKEASGTEQRGPQALMTPWESGACKGRNLLLQGYFLAW